MATGLIALLDDVSAIAKVAAASLDDVAGQAARAGTKAAGVVIDDTAVTPRYLVGFAPERELPIVGKIAMGSIRNKLLILLPAVLALDAFAPWLVTPLLAFGGAFLCYEGAEKVCEALFPHAAHGEAETEQQAEGAALEDSKVAGAIKTDFILSAEIMAIALATIPEGTLFSKAVALVIVAVAITVGVYGVVGMIVKMDDVGLHMARSTMQTTLGGLTRGVGRALVKAMPIVLSVLSTVGTAAMLWVGGGIVLHGLGENGVAAPAHLIHETAHAVGALVPALSGTVEWIAGAALSGVAGLALGAVLIPVVGHVVAPAWRGVSSLWSKSA